MNPPDQFNVDLWAETFERLQNGLQVSEGSGRPSKEDLRSPGENQKSLL